MDTTTPASRPRTIPVSHAVIAAVGMLVLAGLFALTGERSLTGLNDFLPLYVGAELVGGPGLFSPEADHAVQKSVIGQSLDSVYYLRIPVYAAALKPLSWLPYKTAYVVFQVCSFLALLLFLKWAVPKAPEVMVCCALSVAVYVTFLNGQDLMLVLCFASLSVAMASKQRDFAAGLLLGPCLVKPHLFLLIPVAMLIHRRWRMFLGGVAGVAAMVGASFLVAGPGWAADALALLRNPVYQPPAANMPNINGLVDALGLSAGWEYGLCLLTAAAWALLAFRTKSYELAFAFGLLASLLVGYHANIHDTVPLLLAFVLVVRSGASKWLQLAMMLLIVPPLPLFPLSDGLLRAAFPLAGMAVIGLGVVLSREPRATSADAAAAIPPFAIMKNE